MHHIVNNSYTKLRQVQKELKIIQMELDEKVKVMESGPEQKNNQSEEDASLPLIFETLQQKIGKDEESIYTKLNRILFSKNSEADSEKIQSLLDAWKTFDLQQLLETDDVVNQQYHHLYRQVEVLSARVYSKVLDYIHTSRTTKDDKESELLRNFLWEQELDFSYDRYFWKKPIIRHSGISYGSQGVKREEVEVFSNIREGKLVDDWIKNCQILLLKKIQQFMIDIQLIVLDGQVGNNFLLKLERISKKDQKLLFLKNIAYEVDEDAKVLHTNQAKYPDHLKQAMNVMCKTLPNYLFYKTPKGESLTIDNLHQKFKDYKFLEYRHDYIQWMFPNHYGSSFNSKSSQLNYLQSLLFHQDRQIGLRLLKSIYIFLDFMGIRLHLPSLKLSICSFERLKAVILINYHNHLRIMRLLACLSTTGFRQIALSIIQLLDKHTRPQEFLSKERREFEISWGIYGDDSPGISKKRAKEMCFLEDEEFPPEHQILKLLRETMKEDKQNEPEKENPSSKISAEDEVKVSATIEEQQKEEISIKEPINDDVIQDL